MPILDDIMDHRFFGPRLKRDLKISREDGERRIVLRQIAKRFGPVPAAAKKHIEALSAPQLERMALRLLDARSLDELPG